MNIIHLKKGYVLLADDRVVVAHNDTVVSLPLDVDFYIRREKNFKSEDVYKTLQENAYKNKWTKKLHNIVLVPSKKNPVKDTLQTQKGEIPFLLYRNLIIRNVTIEKLNVFGPTVNNPSRPASNWIGLAGNKLHVKTNDRVIKNNLLFKTGDPVNPYTLADNERILRDLPSIEDARIIVDNISSDGDSVDINVIVKDVWSIGFDVDLRKAPDGHVDLWDKNLLGTGQENDLYYKWSTTLEPKSEFYGSYLIRNLAGSFINGRFGYNVYGSKGVSIDLWRDFFTQRTKYAGELKIENLKTYGYISEINQPNYIFPVEYNTTNFWIGRAFPIAKKNLRSTTRANFITSGAVYSTHFFERPFLTDQILYAYRNKTFFLASLAYSNQGYYKSNLVYSFGKTEDIPYGALIKLTGGLERNEFNNRFYGSIKISKGNYLSNVGYKYGGIALGGFLSNNQVQQGMLQVSTNFFTNLLVLKQFKFRHFIKCNYTLGYHRLKDEKLLINDENGITGFSNDMVNGTQRLSLNLETVTFTPYYLWGFRFAFFAYADVALIGNSSEYIFKDPLYSGLGFGLRFRNEKLVFKTFQIRLAYYPSLRKQASGELFTISDGATFRPSDFYAKSPEILQFK